MRFAIRVLVFFLLALAVPLSATAQESQSGVLVNEPAALDGYTFIVPRADFKAYVIDNEGRVVNEWDFGTLTREIHLLDNGNVMILRAPDINLKETEFNSLFFLQHTGDGKVGEYTWDGELVWEYAFTGARQHQHHGIDIMPNGNVLLLLWDYRTLDEALAMGLNPATVEEYFYAEEDQYIAPDIIVEMNKSTSEIVWKWDAWDHLVQNFDETLPNYGSPAENPGRVDINYQSLAIKGIPAEWSTGPADWMHSNSVNYSPVLDQIVISVHRFDEFWIFDRSPGVEDAAGPAGDLLYRWGNPAAYGQGSLIEDRKLFQQHDVQWIDEGLPGAGNILIFNNRHNVIREDEPAEDEYSSVLELKLPLREDGSYDWSTEPELVWQYDTDIYSRIISGVQRLPNGNTLITVGVPGRLVEVTPEGEVVWEFVNPITDDEGEYPWLFRMRKYPADHPGFAGKDLTPGRILGD